MSDPARPADPAEALAALRAIVEFYDMPLKREERRDLWDRARAVLAGAAPAGDVEPDAIVRAAFERSGTYLDGPGTIEAELDEIAEKATGSFARLREQGWDGDVPLAALTHLMTVTTALREVLGLPPSRTGCEVVEHGPWLPDHPYTEDEDDV